MILKVTVHDNDFQTPLENFGDYIAIGNHAPGPEPDKDDPDYSKWALQYMSDDRFLRETLKKTYAESTKEERERVVQIVTDTFAHYVRNRERDTAEYLKRNFRCSVVKSVTDTWRNGEDFFIFPTSYAGKTLCF